jgi:hypothetical protein
MIVKADGELPFNTQYPPTPPGLVDGDHFRETEVGATLMAKFAGTVGGVVSIVNTWRAPDSPETLP